MAKDRKIDLVILGLLCHEDLTGYEIKKRIDNAIGFFWKGSFGNIYPALSDMEQTGYVRKIEGDQSSGRKRIFYHITQDGTEYLEKWLRDEKVSNELRYETLLKLFYGGVAGREVSIHNIEIFETQVKSSLEILYMYRDNLKRVLNEEDHIYYYLTVTFGIESYEAYLKWCTQARELLKSH